MENALENLPEEELVDLINQKNNTQFNQELTSLQEEDIAPEIEILERMRVGKTKEYFTESPEGKLILPFEVDAKQVEAEVLELQKEREASRLKEETSNMDSFILHKQLETRQTIIEFK